MNIPVPSQNLSPPVRLTWRSGTGNPLEQLLGAEPCVIGRGMDCHIRIQNAIVSRHHAKISLDGMEILITDLGSVNGTYVNKQRITAPRQLKDNDIITIGGVEFHFSKPAPPPQIMAPVVEKTLIAPAPAVIPYLEIHAGAGKKIHFELVKEKSTIGRAGHSQMWDLMLPDRAVSRPQAQITRQSEGFVLTDLGSANVTLVNGIEISAPQVLKDGDALTFGETVLVFHAGTVNP
jgi:pSer/pThr/pTyr-binding forkhead associated (FHA) protein